MSRFFLCVCGLFLLGTWSSLEAQSYTRYAIGDTADLPRQAQGGICLMGGATEQDDAARWFLSRAQGGDVVVLRTSGSDGYNAYFYNQLGVGIHSVETFVCHSAAASNDAYLLRRLAEAEALWFAGGDQWDYIQYWRGTAVDSVIRAGIERGLVVGGTSAGMAIQGGAYFTAANGTITSSTALSNPYANTLTVDTLPFLGHEDLKNVITDTHYDNPDRKGRHVTFIARLLQDYGWDAKGIACEEYTAICIDTTGLARVYGDAPTYDDNVYFIQANCDIPNNQPEVCQPNTPLRWDQGGSALKVYHVQGTRTGSNTFNLRNWRSGSGGNWEDWAINNGSLSAVNGLLPICQVVVGTQQVPAASWALFPNPSAATQGVTLSGAADVEQVQIINAWGQVVRTYFVGITDRIDLSLEGLPKGYYWVRAKSPQGWSQQGLTVQ